MFETLNYYYTIDDKKYYSDIEAVKVSKKTNKPVYFQLNYNFIKSGNWQKEPTLPVFHYFDMHSQILKDKYDQIILMYSGGTDSHSILNSFIRCGIRNVILYEVTFAEQKLVPERWKITQDMLKDLSSYSQVFKDLNYRVVSSGLDGNDLLYTEPKNQLFNILEKYKPQKYLDVSHHGGYYRVLNNLNNKFRFDTRRKTAVVWGFSKPTLEIVNDYWYWTTMSSDYMSGKILTTDDYENIYFFITNDVPELQIKLAWLKARKLEQLLKSDYRNDIPDFARVHLMQAHQSPFYREINRAMGYQAINLLLDGADYKPGGVLMNRIRPQLLNNIPAEVQVIKRELLYGLKDSDLTIKSLPIRLKKVHYD